MCLRYAYLTLDLRDQFVDIVNNNAANISSVAVHVGVVDMYKLWPWSCQIMFDKYDAHATSQNCYVSNIQLVISTDFMFCPLWI